jgi:segregation and condensation protein A
MSALEFRLENFAGPLDLLLHLIHKNDLDIYDIQIAEITDQYLAVIDAMQHLNLDVAGEFLMMAATLIHLKSKTLLPRHDEDDLEEEEIDPRAELVRRLLEYQKYKDAAVVLDGRPQLERDVFARQIPLVLDEKGEDELVEVGLFELVEALRQILKAAPKQTYHEVGSEHVSIIERINFILGRIRKRNSLAFNELFTAESKRSEVVATFLAMLELVKMRTVRLMQNARFGSIWLFPAVPEDELPEVLDEDGGYDYA